MSDEHDQSNDFREEDFLLELRFEEFFDEVTPEHPEGDLIRSLHFQMRSLNQAFDLMGAAQQEVIGSVLYSTITGEPDEGTDANIEVKRQDFEEHLGHSAAEACRFMQEVELQPDIVSFEFVKGTRPLNMIWDELVQTEHYQGEFETNLLLQFFDIYWGLFGDLAGTLEPSRQELFGQWSRYHG